MDVAKTSPKAAADLEMENGKAALLERRLFFHPKLRKGSQHPLC